MILNMTGGGGGGEVSVSVVGGTVQPAGKENRIWVNTETEINGYAFSATEPAAATEGLVWLKTGISATAPINLSRKNTVMLYPTNCYQYISGAWVSKTAMTYINGAWLNWTVYLYSNGNQYEAVTGGWDGASSVGEDYLQLTKFYGTATMSTVNAVDLSGFSTLTVRYKYWGNPGAYDASYSNTKASEVKFEVVDEAGNVVGTFANHSISSQIKEANAVESTETLDISSLDKPCKVRAVAIGATTHQSYGGSATINLYEARLE